MAISFDPFGGRGMVPPAFGGPEYGRNVGQNSSPFGPYTDLPSGTIPNLGLPVNITNQNASQPVGTMQPRSTTSGGGNGVTDFLTNFLKDPKNILGLAGLVTALVGGASGGNGQASAESQRLNQITEEKMRRADPLHQAVTQLAWGRLPVSARQGITPPTYKPLS